MVNGESVLRIIPSKFSPPLSFIALLNSSISFLMLRSSFSILEESSPKVLSFLVAWEFDSSSFWISIVRRCSAFWDSIVFLQLFILVSQLFYISQEGLDLLLLAVVQLLAPSHTSRNSFVISKVGLND